MLELVARAVHQIAVWLYKQGSVRSKNDPLFAWRPGNDAELFYQGGFPLTCFWHQWYQDYSQYPEGIADVVGYWAETRILGGVVLFDRREPQSVQDMNVGNISSFASFEK